MRPRRKEVVCDRVVLNDSSGVHQARHDVKCSFGVASRNLNACVDKRSSKALLLRLHLLKASLYTSLDIVSCGPLLELIGNNARDIPWLEMMSNQLENERVHRVCSCLACLVIQGEHG